VISSVVSGIGFLGAGVIMKEGTHVRGLNTAATLWASAAVGAFAGARKPAEAVLVAIFVLAGNTLLRPLVDAINRRPINPGETEALYRVHVVCPAANVRRRATCCSKCWECTTIPSGKSRPCPTGTRKSNWRRFVPTTANPADMDAMTAQITRHDTITSATWSVATTTDRPPGCQGPKG
jgi:putative Mg2+ transporter-C (MgtC) family protein